MEVGGDARCHNTSMSSDGNLSVAFNESASAVNETRMKIPWVALLIASATVWGNSTWDKDFSSVEDAFYEGGVRGRERDRGERERGEGEREGERGGGREGEREGEGRERGREGGGKREGERTERERIEILGSSLFL